jgi:hypothetical protein
VSPEQRVPAEQELQRRVRTAPVGTRPRSVPRVTRDPRLGDGPTLVDVLDRVLDRGVVVQGDVVLSLAGVDLVHIGLQLVIRGLDGPLE